MFSYFWGCSLLFVKNEVLSFRFDKSGQVFPTGFRAPKSNRVSVVHLSVFGPSGCGRSDRVTPTPKGGGDGRWVPGSTDPLVTGTRRSTPRIDYSGLESKPTLRSPSPSVRCRCRWRSLLLRTGPQVGARPKWVEEKVSWAHELEGASDGRPEEEKRG